MFARKLRLRAAAAAAIACGGAGLELASCVDERSPEELAQETVVITKFAPDVDFGTFRTFATGDSIFILTEAADGGHTVTGTVDPVLATEVLEAVAGELTARGYSRVDRDAGPDLGVGVTGVVRVEAAVSFGAWWGFGSAVGGFWGFGGVPFASALVAPVLAIWRSGALVIELYDLRAAREAARVSPLSVPPDAGGFARIFSVWAGFIYGVLGGGLDGSFRTPTLQPMQQAFAQSPYLRAH